ncbi:MAG: hypothetical protein HC838_12375, partial [Spirulinaceae cyanobacterium RM2_2_10]|nr:hypothetical protein [Spirulinaceae cyanobacterium RM2_2_10]
SQPLEVDRDRGLGASAAPSATPGWCGCSSIAESTKNSFVSIPNAAICGAMSISVAPPAVAARTTASNAIAVKILQAADHFQGAALRAGTV